MGYYNILIRKEANKLFIIILTRVRYRYKCLPMGVNNSLENFQEK